jgi:regulator of replication initiation timing
MAQAKKPQGAAKDAPKVEEENTSTFDLSTLPEDAQEFVVGLQTKVAELESNQAAPSDEVEQLKQTVAVLEETNEKLEAEVESLREKAANSTIKKCDGTYKAENGNLYAFKAGFLKVSVKGRGFVPAEECIKDAKIMEKLISIKYGGLEIVKPAAKKGKK